MFRGRSCFSFQACAWLSLFRVQLWTRTVGVWTIARVPVSSALDSQGELGAHPGLGWPRLPVIWTFLRVVTPLATHRPFLFGLMPHGNASFLLGGVCLMGFSLLDHIFQNMCVRLVCCQQHGAGLLKSQI